MATAPAAPTHVTDGRADRVHGAVRRTTETKAAFKTTELIAYVVTVIAVLIAAAVVDDASGQQVVAFDAKSAWLYVTILTAAYMLSRGLAKSGSRDPYWDDDDGSGRNGR